MSGTFQGLTSGSKVTAVLVASSDIPDHYFRGLAFDALGNVLFTLDTTGARGNQGLLVATNGAIICATSGAVDHYANGLPFDLDSKLLVSTADALYTTQGCPFDINGFVSYAPSEATGLSIDTIVVFGASIMEQTFTAGTNAQLAEDAFADNGVYITLEERATSGDNTAQMITRLPAIIAEFAANAAHTLFVVHWAGNDISQLGPYPGGAALIDTNCRAMCQDIKDAGFSLALSDTTYRVPPASNPSLPYNDNVMDAVIADFADIPLALYALSLNTVGWHEVDGTHPSTPIGEDANRVYVADTVSPFISYSTPPLADAVLQFGNGGVYPDDSNSIIVDGTVSPIKNVDLTTAIQASVTTAGIDNVSNQGRGNVLDPSDTSISLTNNIGLKNYAYETSGPINVDLSKMRIEAASLYTVGVTASRDTTDVNRDCDVTVAGVASVLNAAASPAQIVEFTNVLGADLIASGVLVAPSATFTFAYISMIRITKQ